MQMKKASPLTSNRRYETFIKSRDVALEAILRKYLRASDRALDFLKDRTAEIVARHHVSNAELHMMKRSLSALQQRLDSLFAPVESDLASLLYRMRTSIYGLSAYGQSEAILRATGREQRVDLSSAVVSDTMNADMKAGASVPKRVWMALERLKRKISDAYQTGVLHDESTREVIDRVLQAFPRAKLTKRGPKVLKHPKLTESDRDDEDGSATSFAITRAKPGVVGQINPDLWEQMVEDYTSNDIPFYESRQPKDEETYYEEHGQYQWELERDVNQEFVDQVRNGEISAAKENGITDFVWIAVLDNATDECCAERDGMTVTEIEAALDSGKLDSDVCDGTTPPAHFNCRCRIAPLSDDIPDVAPPDWGDFDEWLSQKAGQ